MLDKSECMINNNNVLGGQSPAFGHAQSVSCNEAIGFYIDGFNLYYSLLDICPNRSALDINKHDKNCHYTTCSASQYKWSNLKDFATKTILNHGFNHNSLNTVKLFTSKPHHTNDNYKRHIAFEKAQKNFGVKIVHGRFDNNKKNGQEKETDLNLAINIIDDIIYNNIRKVFLVTNDSDFVPLISWIGKRFGNTKVEIFLLSPPKRNTVHYLRVALCEYYNLDIELLKANKMPNDSMRIYKTSFDLLLQCKMPNIIYNKHNKVLAKNPYIKSNE